MWTRTSHLDDKKASTTSSPGSQFKAGLTEYVPKYTVAYNYGQNLLSPRYFSLNILDSDSFMIGTFDVLSRKLELINVKNPD